MIWSGYLSFLFLIPLTNKKNILLHLFCVYALYSTIVKLAIVKENNLLMFIGPKRRKQDFELF